MTKNSFFNPADKRDTLNRRKRLKELCKHKIIPQQQKNELIFRSKPNEYLIRDKNGDLKKVNKTYYLYHIQDDECETETEIIDEEDYLEFERIKNKYNKIT